MSERGRAPATPVGTEELSQAMNREAKTLHPVLRRIVLGVAVALLLTVAWLGLSDGLPQLSRPRTLGISSGGVSLLIVLAIIWLLRVGTGAPTHE